MKKISATEAMNLYEAALSALPEVMSLHVGFDEDRPAIIVTVQKITESLEKTIEQIAPNAPIKLIQVMVRKPITALEAEKKHGHSIRKIKSVASVDIARKSGKTVLMVRAFPLTESVKANVREIAQNAPIEFRESRHKKSSLPSVIEFIGKKLRSIVLVLIAFGGVAAVLSPLYYAVGDIKFAMGAQTTDGVVTSAERPMMTDKGGSEITQEVAVKFSVQNIDYMFTQHATLFATLWHMDNMNAEPYHKGAGVTVSYTGADPQGTARIFDRSRFWATIILYFMTIVFMVAMAVSTWRRWQEW